MVSHNSRPPLQETTRPNDQSHSPQSTAPPPKEDPPEQSSTPLKASSDQTDVTLYKDVGTNGRKRPADRDWAEELFSRGRRKQARTGTDPLVHYGRHFGRTIRTFGRVHKILSTGINTTMQLDLGRIAERDLSSSEYSDYEIYKRLLALVPNLEERLNTGSNEDLNHIADMITKGVSGARADDTKSLKSAIVDWITPPNGVLVPPIQRNVKTDRGFHHPRTGELLCPCNLNWEDEKIRNALASGQLIPSGDMWPRFLYAGYKFDLDNAWDGLFRSSLLVSAYKHVFTSPSSAGATGTIKATRSSNARIHGMDKVTVPSIAYIATQVRFALSSASTFSRTDTMTDSEYFYFLVIELLEDPEERDEVDDLLRWWNRQVFPTYIGRTRAVHKDCVLAKIKEQRRQQLMLRSAVPLSQQSSADDNSSSKENSAGARNTVRPGLGS